MGFLLGGLAAGLILSGVWTPSLTLLAALIAVYAGFSLAGWLLKIGAGVGKEED